MNSNTIVIIIGVVVQIMTLLGIIFKGGEFIGRMTTLVDGLRVEVTELKEDMKKFRIS